MPSHVVYSKKFNRNARGNERSLTLIDLMVHRMLSPVKRASYQFRLQTQSSFMRADCRTALDAPCKLIRAIRADQRSSGPSQRRQLRTTRVLTSGEGRSHELAQ